MTDRYPLPKITDHAMARFLDLCPSLEKRSKDKIRKRIWTQIANARPAVLKRKYRARQLAKYGGEEVEYRMDQEGRIYVMRGGALLTVHNGCARRWIAVA
ncbi:MAG: hypothetical protein U1G08_02520 [Verrucomicrobiota bacterium]